MTSQLVSRTVPGWPTMPRSYIDSFCYGLGAYSGLLMGLTRQSLLLLQSLSSVRGWTLLYAGNKSVSKSRIASAEAQPFPNSALQTTDPADTARYLGTRPPELVTPPRRGPVYSTSPKFGTSPQQALNTAAAPANHQSSGFSSQPIFTQTSTYARTPTQPGPYVQPASPSVNTVPAATHLATTAPSFYPTSASAYVPPSQSAAVPLVPSAAAPVSVAATSVTPVDTSLPVPSTAVAPMAETSPVKAVTEEFTDDDMSSTAEEIGAQPISNAGKIKKLRTRISSKLSGKAARH